MRRRSLLAGVAALPVIPTMPPRGDDGCADDTWCWWCFQTCYLDEPCRHCWDALDLGDDKW